MLREKKIHFKSFVDGVLDDKDLSVFYVGNMKFLSHYEALQYEEFLGSQSGDISNIKYKEGYYMEESGIWYFIDSEENMALLKRNYKDNKYCCNTEDLKFENPEWVFLSVNEGDYNHVYMYKHSDLLEEIKQNYQSLLRVLQEQ